MTNIPTDVLRTLVTIVDLGSFTKAAATLGLTQPAVSAQIKRLQFLVGGDLFDRSGQGLQVTPHGELVLSYARRLLSINDQIVSLSGTAPHSELLIRVGTSSDYVAQLLPGTLGLFRENWSGVRFIVRTDHYDRLMRELRGNELDVVVGLSVDPPADAQRSSQIEVVWVRGVSTELDPDRPVPLVTYGAACPYHRSAVRVLKAAGLQWEDVFVGPSIASLNNAVSVGLGVMATSRRVAEDIGMPIWEDATLPKLPDLYSGIYVRECGVRQAAYEQLADAIAAVLYEFPFRTPKLVASNKQLRKAYPAA
jgi:DNA-binding transcriptional LysR family regulator